VVLGQRVAKASAAMRASRVASVTDLLGGQVGLDLECMDRLYFNGYVPNLQVGGQVVTFLTHHLGYPIPSPVVFNQIGERFRRAVGDFADRERIPVVRFAKSDRKADVMGPYLRRAAATGRSQVAAIGVAQEFQRVFTGYDRAANRPVPPHFAFDKAERRVSCFYFYLWDTDFGPAFIKICTYFPYPIKVCLLTEPGSTEDLRA